MFLLSPFEFVLVLLHHRMSTSLTTTTIPRVPHGSLLAPWMWKGIRELLRSLVRYVCNIAYLRSSWHTFHLFTNIFDSCWFMSHNVLIYLFPTEKIQTTPRQDPLHIHRRPPHHDAGQSQPASEEWCESTATLIVKKKPLFLYFEVPHMWRLPLLLSCLAALLQEGSGGGPSEVLSASWCASVPPSQVQCLQHQQRKPEK